MVAPMKAPAEHGVMVQKMLDGCVRIGCGRSRSRHQLVRLSVQKSPPLRCAKVDFVFRGVAKMMVGDSTKLRFRDRVILI